MKSLLHSIKNLLNAAWVTKIEFKRNFISLSFSSCLFFLFKQTLARANLAALSKNIRNDYKPEV